MSIRASLDRIISCLCHGKMCVEIKCPYSVNDKSPTDNDVNLNFLITVSDGNKELKKSMADFCLARMNETLRFLRF